MVFFEGHVDYLEGFSLCCCGKTEETSREDAQLTWSDLVFSLMHHWLLEERYPILESVRKTGNLCQYQQLLRLHRHYILVILWPFVWHRYILALVIRALNKHILHFGLRRVQYRRARCHRNILKWISQWAMRLHLRSFLIPWFLCWWRRISRLRFHEHIIH